MINKWLNRIGLQLSRVPQSTEEVFLGEFSNSYEACLLSLLAVKQELTICIVGANDGEYVDPAFPFIKRFADHTKVLLIEPQGWIITHLEENFSFHPNKRIANVAIGPKGDLVLYGVKKECHQLTQHEGTKSWPAYRAPSGIVSANKEHVRRWLRRFIEQDKEIDAAIEEMSVRSVPLVDVLEEAEFSKAIDVLQIDTEGFDDVVIYNSEIEATMPKLIFFEIDSLSIDKKKKVAGFLRERGYFCIPQRTNCLALSPQLSGFVS